MPAVATGPHSSAVQLYRALDEEDLSSACRLLKSTPAGRLPLDAEELGKVGRRVACLARDKLREAVREEDGSLDKVLREVDLIESSFPHAIGMKSSLEYAAARLRQQDGAC
mmetsp:Transcript_126432/g.319302  ORF Transcript_126432/g.319302 Transcript_126432/m.319302 type:complete len:111 (-) Transcript_126432:278-610(-)